MNGEDRAKYGAEIIDTDARNWYAEEAYDQTWSVRTLQKLLCGTN